MIGNDQYWWVSGGCCPQFSASKIYDGVAFAPFEELPVPDDLHHMISVNDTHVVYLEGIAVNTAAIYDLTTNTWGPFHALPAVCHVN